MIESVILSRDSLNLCFYPRVVPGLNPNAPVIVLNNQGVAWLGSEYLGFKRLCSPQKMPAGPADKESHHECILIHVSAYPL